MLDSAFGNETFVDFSCQNCTSFDPPCHCTIVTMMYSSGMPDYSSVMRNTVVTTTEMLELIEQDLAESRLLIRARNADDEIASQLVASLQEDNGLLRVSMFCFPKAFVLGCRFSLLRHYIAGKSGDFGSRFSVYARIFGSVKRDFI